MQYIMMALAGISSLYFIYHAIIAIKGYTKKYEPIAPADATKRIAVVIPARNESRVIGNLVDSIKKQNYPQELFDIYVVPNNCTDDTAKVALKSGSKILNCTVPVHSKGEVLSFAFNKLLKGDVDYDGFVILDADNIVDGGFLQAINDALAAGYQAGQCFRDSKNPKDNWVTSCMSVFFWFMNCLFNQPRAMLGISVPFNGTGIVFGADFLRKNGYKTTSLTEDLEMTAQCALAGEKVAWIPSAITYDEQTRNVGDSIVQRRRWAAGMRQCLKYVPEMLKRGITRGDRVCIDVSVHFSGVVVQLIGTIPMVYTLIMIVIMYIRHDPNATVYLLFVLASMLLGFFVSGMAYALLVLLVSGKMRKSRHVPLLTMGLFLITWVPANLMGYLLKIPTWNEIPHESVVGIDQRDIQEKEDESEVAKTL
ncbi:MAG: glycosyltransferase family 2 protein [Clostridia bacterium]|nr:glycosyltransferase family 2 protein [Clostridia bacterium]